MTEERRPLLPSMASPPQILPANAGASSVLKLERQFPMYVLPLDEVELLERFVPHEDIIDKLVEWKRGMGDVLFVSHTWLGNSHPDPHGTKLKLVQRLVRRMQSKTSQSIEGHAIAVAWYGPKRVRVTAAAMRRCRYLWIDFLSVPQRNPAAQNLAIQSIFSYVHDAAIFVVVAGPWKNEESGQWRDCRQWMRRGWCRLEMLANALSPSVKQVVLAESAASIESHGPSGLFGQQWFTSPVGEADFSVEGTRTVSFNRKRSVAVTTYSQPTGASASPALRTRSQACTSTRCWTSPIASAARLPRSGELRCKEEEAASSSS